MPTPIPTREHKPATVQPIVRRLGLVAGEGRLPLHIAANAASQGIQVIAFSIGRDNINGLKKACQGQLHKITPGMLAENVALFKKENIDHIVFAGKVNKWLLLRKPRLDRMAIEALRQYANNSDDAIMNWIVAALEKEGLTVLRQTRFLGDLFVDEGVLTQKQPDAMDLRDIRYGFNTAREMGRLDIGQSVVVKDGMILAVEAIEGTDECLCRGGKLTRGKGGVVVKVAKPLQDQRFDIPTVGLGTLRRMHRYGLSVLATEAGQTIYLERDEMIHYANRHGMIITSVIG